MTLFLISLLLGFALGVVASVKVFNRFPAVKEKLDVWLKEKS